MQSKFICTGTYFILVSFLMLVIVHLSIDLQVPLLPIRSAFQIMTFPAEISNFLWLKILSLSSDHCFYTVWCLANNNNSPIFESSSPNTRKSTSIDFSNQLHSFGDLNVHNTDWTVRSWDIKSRLSSVLINLHPWFDFPVRILIATSSLIPNNLTRLPLGLSDW